MEGRLIMGAKSDGGVQPMSSENGSEALRERLDNLEKRLRHRNTRMAFILIISGFLLGAMSSCTKTTSDTIEARRIILKVLRGTHSRFSALITTGVDWSRRVTIRGLSFATRRVRTR